MARALVVGAGIFGVTAALELRARGWDVTLADPGPIPHPLAESSDLSKIVRLDYGADEDYTALMERALERWRAWPEREQFHETGVLFVSREAPAPGGFEHDSRELLLRRGHALEDLDAASIERRFPAFRGFAHGYFNPAGGFAESGKVVASLARRAAAEGVTLAEGAAFERLVEAGGRVTGMTARDGSRADADVVVIAAGSWTGHLLPWLAAHFRSTGHPVIHFRPEALDDYGARRFPVFAADISRTGYYGFPAHEGVVKVANHGVGREMHPESSAREVTDAEIAAFRSFLGEHIPGLGGAAIAKTRICVYGDTWDQHLWIAPDPERPGLVVAAGGSGHGFKFAPVLGGIIADAVEGEVIEKFRWRPDRRGAAGEERARHGG